MKLYSVTIQSQLPSFTPLCCDSSVNLSGAEGLEKGQLVYIKITVNSELHNPAELTILNAVSCSYDKWLTAKNKVDQNSSSLHCEPDILTHFKMNVFVFYKLCCND